MSRFFRGPDSSSSSSESEESGDEDKQTDKISGADLSKTESLEESSNVSDLAISQVSDPSGNPRDFLLHALLEERCMQQARNSQLALRFGKDSPEVISDARTKYLELCSRLSSFNLVSVGQEQDRYAATRQQFRDGLLLLDSQISTTPVVPGPLRRLLTDTDTAIAAGPMQSDGQRARTQTHLFQNQLRMLLSQAGPAPNYGLSELPRLMSANSQTTIPPTIFRSIPAQVLDSRYRRDFEELSLLGKGGYGIVYHVRHRLDKQPYAVKKIPLSRGRIARIQQRGQAELDEFLMELQTLARLEHPNIVRYYGGWIEWIDNGSHDHVVSSKVEESTRGLSETSSSRPGEHRRDSLTRVVTQSNSQEVDVVFEYSQSTAAPTSSRIEVTSASNGSRDLPSDDGRITIDTAEEVSLVRPKDWSEEVSSSLLSSFAIPSFHGPTLALHVQMSLHPLTLADFLSPPTKTSQVTPLCHCFHFSPSIDILLAILDGIEYLHGEGIIHRDIKPANVFLGPTPNANPSRGSVNLGLCSDCQSAGASNPVTIQVRIGDFGLVTALSQDDVPMVDNRAIGTETYRPPVATSNVNPCLDIYALGIVAFELLHQFETRMERHRSIQLLKAGQYPPSLAARLGEPCATRVSQCIDAMLSSHNHPISLKDLRSWLQNM